MHFWGGLLGEEHKILITVLVFIRHTFIFWQADVSNTGQIGASDAAAFLKKSGLKEGILHKVKMYRFFFLCFVLSTRKEYKSYRCTG